MSNAPVKQTLEESLSALVDGEATELEVRRLLKASDEQYEDLRDSWLRYQTASSATKSDFPSADFRDLSSSISAAIAEEPAHAIKGSSRKTSIWSGVGRFAVAASVAGAVVLGVQFAPSDLDSTQVATADPVPASQAKVPSSFGHGLPTDTVVSTVSNESSVSKPKAETIIITESTQQQLKEAEDQVNRLMLEHAQNASQNTQQGVLPYARVPESSENQ